LATASSDGAAKLWDLGSGKELIAITGHGGPLFGVAISPDGTLLATAGYDNTAKIWDLKLPPEKAAAELNITLNGHAPGQPVGDLYPGLTTAAFSPDGMRLATGGVDGMAKIWDVKTGQELLSIQAHPERRGITRLAFSADGRLLATASDGPEPLAKIWDVASGAEISSFSGHIQAERIWGAAFSPDGERVATGSWGGGLKIWHAKTGQELLDLVGHTSTVTGLDFSPDGKHLATSSTDGTARVWDLSSGERLHEYTSPGGALFDVAFSPNGKYITASGQGSVYGYVFDLDETIRLASSRLTRWFTPEECRQFLHEEECPPSQLSSPKY
jgi:WD40 repeat protein